MDDRFKHYLVYSKSDDYGACLTELVETTEKNAKEYYGKTEVEPDHVEVLAKYFDLIEHDEESERTSDRRYSGGE